MPTDTTHPAQLGMISSNEQAYLRRYASYEYSGQGEIVDLGCWLGSSTIELAKGLQENPHAAGRKIHAYDLFLWESWMDPLPSVVGTPLEGKFQPGDSFFEECLEQTKPWQDQIKFYPGDLNQLGWHEGEIEFLFIDAMKTWELANTIIRDFFPALVPGRSVIVHQDFTHHHTYWIHLTMYRLRDYFEPVYDIPFSASLVYRYIKQIPAELLQTTYTLASFSEAEIHAAFDDSQRFVSADKQPVILSCKAVAFTELASPNQIGQIRSVLDEIYATYGGIAYLKLQLEQSQTRLRELEQQAATIESDHLAAQMQVNQNDGFLLSIEQSWSNDHSLHVTGWLLSQQESVDGVEICVGDTCVPITNWHARPDVVAKHPECRNQHCGFSVQIPRLAQHQATLNITTASGVCSKTVVFNGAQPIPHQGFSEGGNLFNEFTRLVNEQQLRVLEIGSRIVSPGSTSKRSLFPDAASYTGFDYYADDNTDVVGDAHQLSRYFNEGQRFDAIFSLSVFEHLAMPWLVAKEINQLLEVGGITLHATHNAWPIHEQPWDFWRFSDEALKVLFSPAMGFEILQVGYFEPARIYLDHPPAGLELLPTQPAFGGVTILAKKVAEIDPDRFNWNITIEELLGSASHYPEPTQVQKQVQQPLSQQVAITTALPAPQTAQTKLQKSQETVRRLRKKLERLETQLKDSETEIAAMQSSKFWKLREQWIAVKQLLTGK